VIAIDSEQRIDVLRQVALLLQKENERLHERLQLLTRELAAAKGIGTEALQLEIENLREVLARRNQEIFGRSSEKKHAPKDAKEPKPKAPSGHGRTTQTRLDVIEENHTLDEADRACPCCGGHLDEMTGQFEESEEITIVERSFLVKKHRRQKYRCQCNGAVETAPGPVKLMEGGRYSPDFAIAVVASKYLDHLPLERQVRMMAREGLEVTSQTLWDQLNAVAYRLQPTYQAIRREVLSAPVIGADETQWPLMGSKEKSRWYAWVVASPDAVFFDIQDSRSEASAEKVLDGYGGVLMADGYAVYDALSRGDPNLVVANCWVHVRRKFVEIQENFPLACEQMIALIGELYGVEKSVRESVPPEDVTAYHAALLEARCSQSQAVLDRIQQWVIDQHALPQSAMGRAILYMAGLWKGLIRFIDDPRIPLDNNATERAIRGMVVGRKNHYGSRSQRGTEVAALFYTLIETAKLRGVEPKAYLRTALMAALRTPGAVTLPEAQPAAA
jgi:transposase